MYFVIRNGQKFGPYDISVIHQYVNTGQILLSDEAQDQGSGETNSVKVFLQRAGLKAKIQHKGNLFSQIKDIGSELIFPKKTITSRSWAKDRTLLFLAALGLLPTLLWFLPLGTYGSFYFIALYFSVIWGMFFYYLFRTPQVTLKNTVTLFFSEQAFVFLLLGVVGLQALYPFQGLSQLGVPFNFLFYILGVGMTEEFVKLLPLLLIAARAKQPLVPQTMVFYGLMSGIAFGVYEGVHYQISSNSELEYTQSFIFNISRLTSLPFMHAIWCGIAGYFISFAKLYPKYRISLYVLALIVPAILHGLYDSFASENLVYTIIALVIAFVSVIMLMTYLKQGVNYQSKLRS